MIVKFKEISSRIRVIKEAIILLIGYCYSKKEYGDLCIGQINNRNEALLAKWLRRFSIVVETL